MIIDFHTHVFPDKIADVTIQKLSEKAEIKAYTDGKLTSLQESMIESGIDLSVVLPVVTRPSQFDTINEYAVRISSLDGIISFGGIHPDSNNHREELKQISQMGLKGIKLHPDYQLTYIDDVKNIRIIDDALSLGLTIVIHAGMDVGYPSPVHCTPKRCVEMLKQVSLSTDRVNQIVLAHTGGFEYWDDVEELLTGKNIFFDLSYSLGKMKTEQLMRIIRNHGSNRILFATDSPWGGQKEMLKLFNQLPLNQDEKKRILYQNACELLDIKFQ